MLRTSQQYNTTQDKATQSYALQHMNTLERTTTHDNTEMLNNTAQQHQNHHEQQQQHGNVKQHNTQQLGYTQQHITAHRNTEKSIATQNDAKQNIAMH